MDKNTITGFILIFGILLVWNMMMAPDAAQLEKEQHIRDSIAQVEQQILDKNPTITEPPTTTVPTTTPEKLDSQTISEQQTMLKLKYGEFYPAATGTEKTSVLENNVMKVTFSNKGGRITEVLMKEHFKMERDSLKEEHKVPLYLMEDEKDRFEYLLPMKNAANKTISSQDLYFTPSLSGNKITFKADAGDNRSFEQVYTIKEGSYGIDYNVHFNNLNNVLNAPQVKLNWLTYLDRLELNYTYEQMYSSVYFKETDDSYDYCSCTGDDKEEMDSNPIKWMAHSNQFFCQYVDGQRPPVPWRDI